MKSRIMIRAASGEGPSRSTAATAAIHRRRSRRPTREEVARVPRTPSASPRARLDVGRCSSRRRSARPRRGRLRPAHVPLRPVRLREDLRARRRARAAPHHTALKIVVLDPNSDFVRLGETRADAGTEAAARHAEVSRRIAVRRAGDGTAGRLQVHALDPATQAAVLRLDPSRPRGVRRVRDAVETPGAIDGTVARRSPTGGRTRVRSRIKNLGVDRWGIWSAARTPGRWRRSTATRAASWSTSARCRPARSRRRGEAVLDALWRQRERRRAGADRDRRGAQRLPAEPADPITPARPRPRTASPPRAASSGSTCSSPPSGRRRCARTSSASATTCCSCG